MSRGGKGLVLISVSLANSPLLLSLSASVPALSFPTIAEEEEGGGGGGSRRRRRSIITGRRRE